MSAVKNVAKVSLYLFGIGVLLLVGGAIYVYVNMNSLAKDITEQVASNALGVRVSIGEMDIRLEDKKVVVHHVQIANPKGYKNPNAVEVGNVTVALDSWSKDMVTFAMIGVGDTKVDLEVKPQGTNLGDLKKKVEARSATVKGNKPTVDQVADVQANKHNIKVIVKEFAMTGAQITPSTTLIPVEIDKVDVPEIRLSGIGEKENGVLAHEAVAQIMNGVLKAFNKSSNKAGLLQGLPLDVMNDIGVSTIEVFQKNLKESYEGEVDRFKEGVKGLKGLFE